MSIELYRAPRDIKVHVKASDGSTWITVHHVDGMYSSATTEKGAHCVGPVAWAELEQRPDGSYDLVHG